VYQKRLVPADFSVPEVKEFESFRLRILTVHDVVKDYAAVMSSVEHLQGALDPESTWPRGLTLEQDLVDLGWHQYEFQTGSSFAFTVMALDESRCLGCVYILPSRKRTFDATVQLWVRKSEYDKGLDAELEKAVREWIGRDWPFRSVAYPGRDIEWDRWRSLADR
jgi:hypothetical protein